MDRKYYALNYQPEQINYGQTFLYDGVHDFNYWKENNKTALINKELSYKDYWNQRDQFVHNNRLMVDNINDHPIKDIINFSYGASRNERISQAIASKQQWLNVKNIAEGTGTIIGFDTETIGDAMRENLHTINNKLQNYDGYAGITEVGFNVRNFKNGIQTGDNTVTLAISLNKQQLSKASEALARYKNNGINALDDAEKRMLEWFSSYGYEDASKYFKENNIDFLGNKTFMTIDSSNIGNKDIYNLNRIEKGINNWKALSTWQKQTASKDYVLKEAMSYLDSTMNDSNKALVLANASYDSTVLAHELKDIGINYNPKGLYDNAADVVYANEIIASSRNESVYKMQQSTGNNILSVNNPASVQASLEAAGIIDKETHIAGLDSKQEIDIAINKHFIGGKTYYDTVIDSIDTVTNNSLNKNTDNYYVFNRGSLNKNKLDHAVLNNGEETQSYSFRNRYLSIDYEHSGYVQYTPLSEEGVEAQTKTSYILSMYDDEGNIIRKEFESEAAKDKFLNDNSMQVSKSYDKKRLHQRQFQNEIADIDLARREYDSLFNVTDVRMNGKFDENGFAKLSSYMTLIDEIDKVGFDNITYDELNKISTNLFENGKINTSIQIKSDTQKKAFNKLYTKLKSEQAALNEIVNYINTIPDLNNYQKTYALNKIMSGYKNEITNMGFKSYNKRSNTLILEDALGIDLMLNNEIKRINGSNIDTIQNDLSRIFKNSSRDEISDSFKELFNRNVITENEFNQINKLISANVATNSFYNTVYRDAAYILNNVTQPLNDYAYGPISFMNNLFNKNLTDGQIVRIQNKNLFIRANEIIQNKTTSYYGKQNRITTMSNLITENNFSILSTGNMKTIVDDTIQSVRHLEYLDNNYRNEMFGNILNDLGYNKTQQETFLQMFVGKKGNEYKPYAIDGRSNIQSFIIPPTKDGNAFLLLTNSKNVSKVNEILMNGLKSNTLEGLRQEIGNHAGIIELKRLNKTYLGSLSEFGLNNSLNNVFGDAINLVTTKQGNVQERFILPKVSAYEYGGKINFEIKTAGDILAENYRLVGAEILDNIEAGNFDEATRIKNRTNNSYLENLSTPSSARAYLNKNGTFSRSINYNLNDLSNAFKIDYSEISKLLELEALKAIEFEDTNSPIYQLIKGVGIESGIISKNTNLNTKNLNDILTSSNWKEFYIKNLFIDKVSNDGTFKKFYNSVNTIMTKPLTFEKNIYDIIVDVAKSNDYRELFTDDSIKSLETFQEISHNLYQVLGEKDVKNFIASIVSPGQLRDLGAIDPSLRPTFTQALNALMFDPEDVTTVPKGTTIGSLSKTDIENTIMQNINIKSPSGKAYNTQEHTITTAVKQMSDMELQLRYKDLQTSLDVVAKQIEGVDVNKFKEAFKIFTSEYSSLYEDKTFGAPMLHNQLPFMSSDVKKVSIPELAKFNDIDLITNESTKAIRLQEKNSTIARLNEYLKEGKILNNGDVIGTYNGNAIFYKGPSTQLTQANINEFLSEGTSTITPSSRMVSDTKWMLGSEKRMVHFTLIDDNFMKKNPIFESANEALFYMQKMFDLVSGYDGTSGYQPTFITNMAALKSSHNTAIALDSAYYTIINEYKKSGKLNQLTNVLSNMNEFNGWNFRLSNNGEFLISNQSNKFGMQEGIHRLYDIILSEDEALWKNYFMDADTNRNIVNAFKNMQNDNVALVQAQRMNVNEIMGTSLMMDERMQQAIRLRGINERDTYYESGYYKIDGDNKPIKLDGEELENALNNNDKNIFKASDGIIDEYNGRIINGKGRSWSDLYLDELKANIKKGVYDEMNVSEFGEYKGIKGLLQEVSKERQAQFAKHRKNQSLQEKVIGGYKEALLYSINEFDVNTNDVIRVNMDDALKRLPSKNSPVESLQEFLFTVDGKSNKYLNELTDSINNKSSIYLDFGTTINGKNGIVIPLLNVSTLNDKEFPNKSAYQVLGFLNKFKDNIGQKNGEKEIAKAINDLFDSFSKELLMFDKDSLLYKTAGKILLPNSGQELAFDEIAPIVDAMLDNEMQTESIKKEKLYRQKIAQGDTSYIKKLDDLLESRKILLNNIADSLESGSIDDSLYSLSGLSINNNAVKGFIDIGSKRYFTNTFETSETALKNLGVNFGEVGLQLYNDFTKNNAITRYETNEAFNQFIEQEKYKIVEEFKKPEMIKKFKKANVDFDETNVMKSLDDYIISIKDINQGIIKSKSNKMASVDLLADITKVFENIGKQYITDVGIMAREGWRPPYFGAQAIVRMYLNNTMEGNQLRANNPVTSIITNVDFDGDAYMTSLDLNGSGLRTIEQQKLLVKAYEASLSQNTTMMADLIRSGDAYVSHDITDLSLIRFSQLESFDSDNYESALKEWARENNINKNISDLTEGELLSAAHSDTLRRAYNQFDIKNNMVDNTDIIKASLAARIRKDGIGSISTPNYKLRETLINIHSKTTDETVKNKTFNILKNLSSLSSDKLLDITEQKSIDVKHIYDAVNLAETGKWVKGIGMLFNKKQNINITNDGLYMMMKAVNNSTFKMNEEELLAISKEIITGTMEKFEKELNDSADKNLKTIAKFKLEFRALYEATTLPDAYEIQNSILRSKNPLAVNFAEALKELESTDILENDSVFGDLARVLKKQYSDESLLIDSSNIYFKSGDLAQGNDIIDKGYILDEIKTTKNNTTIKLQQVDLDTLEPIDTHTISANNKKTLNMKLKEFLDDIEGINKYVYMNSDTVKENALNTIESSKINRNINAILFNTGYDTRNGFDVFKSFNELDSTKQIQFGLNEYGIIKKLFSKEENIINARELLNDYQWAKNENFINSTTGVDSLIKQLNADIANRPERYMKNNQLDDYDTILKDILLSDKYFSSESYLDEVHSLRISLKDFDNKKYKDFLNTSTYDIINSKQALESSYEALEKTRDILSKHNKEIPEELENVLNNKETKINQIIDNIILENQSIIKNRQDNIYDLFKDTNQMDARFFWGSARRESIVGFGEYMGTQFIDLTKSDIDAILKTNISDTALKSMTEKEAYATKKTVELLREYSKTAPIKTVGETVLKDKQIATEVLDNLNNLKDIDKSVRADLSASVQKEINKALNDRKTLSGSAIDSAKETLSKIPKRAIGIGLASMAALGIVNNVLHNQKVQSPLTPARSNDYDKPDTNYSPESNIPNQAPMSKKRVVYHDKGSNFNFKVSARTNNYINNKDNANLIAASGGGQSSVYSETDMSRVNDNWLANKFAELA